MMESVEPRRMLATDFLITEFMAKNDGFLEDGDGNAPDWVEIQNVSQAVKNLEGYHLTDSLQNLTRWNFPSYEVKPGDYLVVFASGQETKDYIDAEGNLHTNFSLSSSGERLALVDPDGQVVSQFGDLQATYPEQSPNRSYGIAQQKVFVDANHDASYWIPTDNTLDRTWYQLEFDTEGSDFVSGNAAIGFEGSPNSRFSMADEIITSLPDEPTAVYARMEFELDDLESVKALKLQMKYDDGFVAYLNGKPVAEFNAPLVKTFLSTSTGRRTDRRALEYEEFDLNPFVAELRQGSNVLAIHGLNHEADLSSMLVSPRLVAVTQSSDARVGFMTEPTPGAPNVAESAVYTGFNSEPTIDVEAGFFEQPFSINLQTSIPDSQIRFTTDGSRPTPTNGTLYTGSIQVDTTTTLRAATFADGRIPSDVVSRSYLFLNDVIRQSNDQPGLPTRWKQSSFDFAADYEMDQGIVDDPAYKDDIVDGLKSIRTMSITLDPEDFLADDGIYINTARHGVSSERPISVEIIHGDGTPSFQVDAGLRNHGNRTRDFDVTLKQSFRIVFSRRNGPRKLEYPLFEDAPVERFDNIILHAGKLLDDPQLIRNSFGRDSNRAMGNVDAESTYFHLYLNGLYWGVYNAFERIDAEFAQTHFGGSDADYDAVLNHSERIDGDTRKYNAVWRQLRGGIETEEQYNELQRNIDLDNLFDFLLINQYMAHDEHESRAIGKREGDADFKFFIQDVDEGGMDRVRLRTDIAGFLPGSAYSQLVDNPETMLRYADRAHKHLHNGGALSPEAAASRWNARVDELYTAVISETARWGDTHWRNVFPRNAVQRDVELAEEHTFLNDEFFPQRADVIISQLRRSRAYPSIDAPDFSRFGGDVARGFELDLSHPNEGGTIYYTIDGSDPRKYGGDVLAEALVYDGSSVAISSDLTVKARVLSPEGEWSALTAADFAIVTADLNQDGMIDASDIDTVCEHFGSKNPIYDLNGDQIVNLADAHYMVRTLLNTVIGDANLDGVFNSQDLNTDEYDDGIANNSTWAEGDWNCDGEFDSRDLVIAYSEVTTVPEAAATTFDNSRLIAGSLLHDDLEDVFKTSGR